MDVSEVLADLLDEQKSLDGVVSDLAAKDWDKATASPRWAVRHQIAHLAYFDKAAATAISDPEAFQAMAAALFENSSGSETSGDDFTLGSYVALEPDELLEAWRAERSRLASAAARLENETRVAWYGPSMGSKSFLTARLMEAWAHGQDIVDALGIERVPSDRIRHIVQLGFITRGWTYLNRTEDAPSVPVRVSLKAPSGAVWDHGPTDALESITGPAIDFCQVVTQRRHVDDTALVVVGDAARDWMLKAQCFAGPATDGPVSRGSSS